MWIGLQDQGDWTWIDGDEATWTNWAPNEPQNVGKSVWETNPTCGRYFLLNRFDNDESSFIIIILF